METLNIQELTDLACIRYGQLITPLDIYQFDTEACEKLLIDVVEEYSHFIPMTKELTIQGSPSGTFLGDDIISVRNVRMDNFYFSKLSPRMDRRQRKFNAHTKMLYMPLSMPVIVECGAKYPVGRISVVDDKETLLAGDTSIKMSIINFREHTLSITAGEFSWNDKNSDYSEDIVTLEGTAGTVATYTKSTKVLLITGITAINNAQIVVKYNTDKPVVQGLGLRDRLFVDLFIGRLMLALGNAKSQLVMDGDVVGFANDELTTQGQALVESTLALLMSSSTTYKVI
jgi:hypothetical protein